jgi:transcriptional regulator with GAF, ATPase, and Fis domain
MARDEQSAAQLLHAVRNVLSQVAEPSKVLKEILGQAVARTGADRGLFAEVTRSGRISYRVLYRFQARELDEQVGSFSRNVFARALTTGKSVRVENALDDPRFRSLDSIQDLRLTSILCAPIRVVGKIAALVHLESDTAGHFTAQHESLLGSLSGLAADALAALQAGEGMRRERDAARESHCAAQHELEESREALAREWSFRRFVGRTPLVRELETTLHKAADTDFSVLLLGETGTGKNILARVLHHVSPRSRQPFVTIFCPSLEKGMVETELFGHKRGAFTGAVADRIGKIQAAEKGSLFLDEIGELPLEIQPKLLRLLQERTFERVGDPTERPADVRVITATNRDLAEEVRAGRFRRDLYERLNYVPLRIPPLRERKADIPLLLEHCLRQHDAGRWIEVAPESAQFLIDLDFSWPGNVRHLEQLAARLALERPEHPVTADDLRRLLDVAGSEREEAATEARPAALELGLPALLAQEEKKWLQKALEMHPDLTRADLAAKLKISEAALYKKLRMYELTGR